MYINLGDWSIRNWVDDDELSLVKYANNYNIWINVDDVFPHPYTRKDAKNWIESTKQLPQTNFAIASSIEAIGGIGFKLKHDIYRRSAEVGYWLGESYWGKGIVSKALAAIKEYAFTNFDLVRLSATVFEWNKASARVLEKNGFSLEGRLIKSITKNGNTVDSLLYAITR
jgi:[ribosomal protein S5]-alanine N-acetyltransferase